MASFSDFIGNTAVVAEAKRELGLSRVTIVVGRAVSGRTTFVRCLEAHFRRTHRFEFVDIDAAGGEMRRTLRTVVTRRQGVMEAYAGGRGFTADARELRVVLDDLDAGERGIVALIEDLIAESAARVGVILVTDATGLRKLSLLKKKGALVLTLTAPGKDAVARWARRTLLPPDAEEDDAERLRAMLRACRHSIYHLKKAYAEGLTVEQAADDAAPDSGFADCDNATTLARLFSRPAPPFNWLFDTVCHDGGSMMGQLAWHNAAALMDEPAYVAALAASLHGLAIERGAHLRHDFSTCALGHALAIAPYAGAVARADRGAMTYTTTMAQGGARAVARRALTTVSDDRSVSECAWEAALAAERPPARTRAR